MGRSKKINSDLSTPLNIASLINHIDMIGSSYTGSKTELIDILNTNGIYNHEIALGVVAEGFLLQLQHRRQLGKILQGLSKSTMRHYRELQAGRVFWQVKQL